MVGFSATWTLKKARREMVDITSSQDIQEPVEIEQVLEVQHILEEQERGSTHFLHFPLNFTD